MEEKVLAALEAAGEVKVAQLAEQVGEEKAAVDKVIKKLVKEEKVYSPKRCFYAVKK